MSIEPLKNYTYIEFDHEYAAVNCDPNVYKPGYGLFNGDNSIFRKCLYGKESFEYSLEYGKKFWKIYKNNKRFLRVVCTYSHEYSYEKAKYSDDLIHDFLKELFETNQLKDTTIFIAADHGFFLMGIYNILNSKDFTIETNLPFFFLIVPDKKNITYNQQYSEIIKNQQNLVTPFDIFYTLRYIIYDKDYKKAPLNGNFNEGENLFKNINPKERTCKKYNQMNKLTCQCVNY
jgi:membrane-anchored protein YejM (alkaline phosphatase superfamily)